MVDHKKKFEEILKLFLKAEAEIRNVTHITNEAPHPAINELRYYARHLLNIVNDKKDPAEEFQEIKNHGERAIYDANEFAVLFFLEEITNFRTYYNEIHTISTVIPNYIECLRKAEEIKEFIRNVTEQYIENREKYCSEIKIYVNELNKVVQTFRIAQPQVVVHLKEIEKKDRKFIITCLFSVLAILIAIIIAYSTI